VSENPGRRGHLVVYALVGLVVVVGLLVGASRRSRTIPLGTPVRLDDFSFAVVDVRRLDAIDGLKAARGSFLVLRLGVRNQAKRVDFQLDAGRTLVEGRDGRRFGLDAATTTRLASTPNGLPPCDGPIPAGKSCTTDLVFDVPRDLSSPRFRLGSGAIGDILDGIFEGGRIGFSLDKE
jgi:hypothetical protein